MLLDIDGVWSMSKAHIRALTAVEVLSRNHSVVPERVVRAISNTKCNHRAVMEDLCRHRFIRYEDSGYRLLYSGYDCLAISTLRARGLETVGHRVGTGKESDVYCGTYNGESVAIKFHRLGRTSFRSVKRNRNYHDGRDFASWLYLSRLSATSEANCLEALQGMRVPRIVDRNRHVVVMEYLFGFIPLCKSSGHDKEKVYAELLKFVDELYSRGFVHGDLSEFNTMVNDESDIMVIDFPQCVPVSDPNHAASLERDLRSIDRLLR